MKKQHSLYFGLSICLAFASCKPHDKFHWNAGWSAPKHYAASPSVEYLYKGQSLAGASANIGADPGWGETSGGYTGGDKYKDVPDSVHLHWLCSTDGYYYEGGFRLPREKMLKLFKQKAIDTYGEQQDYGLIVAGLAPGGNATIWMKGGTASTEIAKFKVKNMGVWQEHNEDYQKEEREIASSKAYINCETNIYHNLHGIPYSVWEKGEKEYDYDIGFISNGLKINPFITDIITKDGSVFQYFNIPGSIYSLDTLANYSYEKLPNNNLKKKSKLPVQLILKWKKIDSKNYYYRSFAVLPQDFESKLDKGRNRLIIESIDYDFANLYLINSKGKQKIMMFKFESYDDSEHQVLYSLPKGFVFPKWEGREKLTFPDLDYWQENKAFFPYQMICTSTFSTYDAIYNTDFKTQK